MSAVLECFFCHKPLTNGLDTFGPVGEEVCQSCYLSVVEWSMDHCRRCGVRRELNHDHLCEVCQIAQRIWGFR